MAAKLKSEARLGFPTKQQPSEQHRKQQQSRIYSTENYNFGSGEIYKKKNMRRIEEVEGMRRGFCGSVEIVWFVMDIREKYIRE